MTSKDAAFWDHQVLRASPAAHSLSIGGKAVLFDETSQNLFQQNDSSAAIWRAVAAEGSLAGAAKALAGGGGDYAHILQYAREAGLAWLKGGLLRPAALAETPRARAALTLGWAGCGVGLDVAETVDAAPLREVFGDLATTTPPTEVLHIERIGDLVFISDDKGRIRARSESEWIPEVKALFTTKLLETVTAGFLAHAALVSRNGQGVLICGAPGAGKTTLSVSLALGGFDYHADDIVQVLENGEARGAPFAPAVKEGSWPLLAQMGADAQTLPAYLRSDGQQVRYLRPPMVSHEPVKPGAILLLARTASGPGRIETVEPLEVLTTILGSAYSARGALSPAGLKTLAGGIEQARIGRLCFSEWSDARRLVDGFAP